MSENHIAAYIILSFSYILGILAAAIPFMPYSSFNPRRSNRKSWSMVSFLGSTLLMLLAYLIGINAFSNIADGGFAEGMTKLISGTLGFFSLDAEYTQFIHCAQAAFCGKGVHFFYFEYCIYVLLAPVIGGAFILNVITEFLPAFKLWLDCRKTKYVFSELNERSITLAESIAKLSWELNRWHSGKAPKAFKDEFDKIGIESNEKKWLKSACIVFTDAYADKRVENSSELLMRAQRIGAICLKDDILERPFHWCWARRSRKLVYFLMDSNEENNVTTAISLLSAKSSGKSQKKTERNSNLWGNAIRKKKIALNAENDDIKKNKYTSKRQVEMYVFTQSGESARLIDKAKDEFIDAIKNTFVDKSKCRSVNKAKNELVKKLKKASQYDQGEYAALKKFLLIKFNLRVKCINEYRNLVYKMFDDRELLDTFISQTGHTPIYKSDAFLEKHDVYKVWHHYFDNNSTDDSSHTIGVVILGAGRLAKEYIKTAAWCYKMCSDINDCRTDHVEISVFAQNATELQNQLLLEAAELLKYDCKARFFNADFPSVNLFALFQSEINLKKRPVQKVLVALGNDHMNYDAARWIKACFEQQLGINTANIQPIVIDFAIENNDLCEVLYNEFNADKDKNGWCVLRPFSTLKDCFSYASVRMDDLEKRGLEADRLHKRDRDESDYFNDNYNWKSSVAVALHTVYKWFSQAKIGDDTGSLYKLMLSVTDPQKQIGIDKRIYIKRQIENKIYWLEHRRWIAYMHSEGYRCPTAKEFVNMAFDRYGSYVKNKDDLRRLHACILFSGDEHIDKERLIKKFFDYHLKDDHIAKVEETIESCDKNEFLQQLKDKAAAVLKIKIKQMQEHQADRPLSEWLEDIVLPEDNEIDDLDRLSLLVTLTTTSKPIASKKTSTSTTGPTIELTNFKDYDIELSRGLCLQILRLQIEKYFDEENYNDNTKPTLISVTDLYLKTKEDNDVELLKALAEQEYRKYIKRGNSTRKTKELLDFAVKFLINQENAKKISISDNLELVQITDSYKKTTKKNQYTYTDTDKLISWTFCKVDAKKEKKNV